MLKLCLLVFLFFLNKEKISKQRNKFLLKTDGSSIIWIIWNWAAHFTEKYIQGNSCRFVALGKGETT